MLAALAAVALSLLPSHTSTLSPVVRPHRRAAIVLSEGESPSQPESIFTLDERKDGWDDVRSSIKDAIKERAGGIQELNAWNEKYIKPTTKWAKVIVEELPLPPVELPLPPLVGSATKAAASMPAATKPAAQTAKATPPDSLKKQAFSFAAATLDAAAKKKAASPKPAASSSGGSTGKQVTPEAATVATANLLLLAGVPIGTLGVLYLLATGSF
jgi:hypothetical protein